MIRTLVPYLVFALGTAAQAAVWAPPAASCPGGNVANWYPGTGTGVIGGIPSRTTVVTITAAPYNADNTGANDCTAAIEAAVNAVAGTGDVIYFPAGTYLVSGNCTVMGKGGFTLRGAGQGATTLVCKGSTYGLYFGTSVSYGWNSPATGNAVTGGLTQGSTVLTLASTSGYAGGVGSMVQIQQANQLSESAIEGGTYPQVHVSGLAPLSQIPGYARSQKAVITALTATTMTISPELMWNASGTSVLVEGGASGNAETGIGIESMTLDCSQGSTAFGIWLEECVNSWITNVTVKQANNYDFFLQDCVNCQVQHCFADSLQGSGTNGATLLVEGTTASLFENNIFYKGFPNIEVDYGCSGNVFGYNFCYALPVAGDFGIDTNHGAHNAFNLYEGNLATNLECDGYFGSTSNDTVFRNWFTSTSPGFSTLNQPIKLKRFTRGYILAANQLGTAGQSIATYEWGYPNIGNGSAIGSCQPSQGTFWGDWQVMGTIASGGGSTGGTITLANGLGHFLSEAAADGDDQMTVTLVWNGGKSVSTIPYSGWSSGLSGATLTVSGASADLPANGTSVQLFPGQEGFQEQDLDVQASTTVLGNYETQQGGIPASEALGSTTFPASLYRTSAPSWWGNLPWPAYDPVAPSWSLTATPAGYYYENGTDPATANETSSSGSSSSSTSTTGTPPPATPAAPSFTEQPASASAAAGATVTFTAAASGTPSPTYQWEVSTNGGSSWSELTDGGAYSGSATDALTITDVPASDNGNEYCCVATNSAGSATSATAALSVTAAPSITSASTASATAGSAFSYTITATNAPTSYGASNLPAGLSVDSATGVISGTPAASGTTAIALSATNAGGTGTGTLTLTVAAAAQTTQTQPAAPTARPVITSPLLVTAKVGTAFTYQITATNDPTSYIAVQLPPGLKLNTATGLITGTPTSSGTFWSTIAATNAVNTGTATLQTNISANSSRR